MQEAATRIKNNKLLENAGWRFFADAKRPINEVVGDASVGRAEQTIYEALLVECGLNAFVSVSHA